MHRPVRGYAAWPTALLLERSWKVRDSALLEPSSCLRGKKAFYVCITVAQEVSDLLATAL